MKVFIEGTAEEAQASVSGETLRQLAEGTGLGAVIRSGVVRGHPRTWGN